MPFTTCPDDAATAYDVPMTASPPSDVLVTPASVALVAACVRVALAAEAGLPVDTAVRWGEADPEDVVRAVTLHRVASLVMAHADALEAPPGIRESLRALARRDAMTAMRLSVESVSAVRAVQAEGIPVVLFKGIALSSVSAGTAHARGAGDIDLLVRPDDLRATHAALTEAGWGGDPLPEPGRGWSHYLRMRRERSYAREASTIDLHWRVGWHDRPIPSAATLIGRADMVQVNGADVPTLGLDDAFSVACYSSAVDRHNRLRGLVDVVRLARRADVRMPAGADWRLRRVVGEAVALASDVVGGIPDDRRDVFVPAEGVDRDRLRSQWEHSSVRPLWSATDVPLRELIGIYRDSARLGGAWPAFSMAVVDGILPPERVPAGGGVTATARVVADEMVDLVRRRVLRTGAAS